MTIASDAKIGEVEPKLLNAFYGAAAEYKKPVRINSGYRSDEHQAELWVRGNILGDPNIHTPAKPQKAQKVTIGGKEYEAPGQPPGSGKGSSHLDGHALDLNDAPGMDAAGVLQKYGLFRPYPEKDGVHIQLAADGRRAPGKDAGDTASPSPAEAKHDAAKVKEAQVAASVTPAGGGSSTGQHAGGAGGGAPAPAAAPAPSMAAAAAPAAAAPTPVMASDSAPTPAAAPAPSMAAASEPAPTPAPSVAAASTPVAAPAAQVAAAVTPQIPAVSPAEQQAASQPAAPIVVAPPSPPQQMASSGSSAQNKPDVIVVTRDIDPTVMSYASSVYDHPLFHPAVGRA